MKIPSPVTSHKANVMLMNTYYKHKPFTGFNPLNPLVFTEPEKLRLAQL